MGDLLTFPTDFTDLSQLAEGFVDRVQEDRLILYGPVPYDDGAPIEFVILLLDGSVALEGQGAIRVAADGGDQRTPETRYDLVIEKLSFEGSNEVFFDRLLMAREAISERPPSQAPTPEAAENEVELVDEELIAAPDEDIEGAAQEVAFDEVEVAMDDEVPQEEPPSEESDISVASHADLDEPGYAEAATSIEPESVDESVDEFVVDDSEYVDVVHDVSPLLEPAPSNLTLDDGAAGLMRPSTHSAEPPHAVPPRDPRTGSGLFAHGAPIPLPPSPPEPSIDPSRRIQPARSPQGESADVEADNSVEDDGL